MRFHNQFLPTGYRSSLVMLLLILKFSSHEILHISGCQIWQTDGRTNERTDSSHISLKTIVNEVLNLEQPLDPSIVDFNVSWVAVFSNWEREKWSNPQLVTVLVSVCVTKVDKSLNLQCGLSMMSWVNPCPFIEMIHTLRFESIHSIKEHGLTQDITDGPHCSLTGNLLEVYRNL